VKKTYIDRTAFRYKLAYDGIDLISKPLGASVIGSYGRSYINKYCRLNLSSEQIELFISRCIQERKANLNVDLRGLSQVLCDKYEVGLLTISEQQCIPGSDYVLLNKEQLDFWKDAGLSLFDAQFMVVPSRDWHGKINEVGFRILDQERVHYGFKWLFPIGQQATFGLHKCGIDKRLILCEGFLDYVALTESGHKNVVGLGSVDLTSRHLCQLDIEHYSGWVFCFDMDHYGLLKSGEFIDQNRACFYQPEGKDPYEVYQKYGHVELVFIK